MIQLFERDDEVSGTSMDDKLVHILDPTSPRRDSSSPKPTFNIRQETPPPLQQRLDKRPELCIVEVSYTTDTFLPYETKSLQRSDISRYGKAEFV